VTATLKTAKTASNFRHNLAHNKRKSVYIRLSNERILRQLTNP
jgi:hypothetical protein